MVPAGEDQTFKMIIISYCVAAIIHISFIRTQLYANDTQPRENLLVIEDAILAIDGRLEAP